MNVTTIVKGSLTVKSALSGHLGKNWLAGELRPDQNTGEIVPVEVHNFKDGHGELYFAWHSPELDRGLRKADIGWEVLVKWEGKNTPKGAKHPQNRFRVAVKAPAI